MKPVLMMLGARVQASEFFQSTGCCNLGVNGQWLWECRRSYRCLKRRRASEKDAGAMQLLVGGSPEI
jgi:hypothetical protein